MGEKSKTQRLTSSRATAVIGSIRADAGEIGARWARLSRAVANTIAEVLIGAETGDIGRAAAQGSSKTKHGLNAACLPR